MHSYRLKITPDEDGTFLITFPEVPEAIIFAESEADVLQRAEDALHTALAGYIADRRPIPAGAGIDTLGRKAEFAVI